MSNEEEQNKGFKVTDRRSFTPEGERRADRFEESEEEPKETERAREPERPKAAESAGRPADAYEKHGVEVRFLDLLSMLATQASIQLEETNPVTGQKQEDLQGARVMISMIEVLKEKTEGNLTRDESEALDEVLYQLRMRFMARAKVVNS